MAVNPKLEGAPTPRTTDVIAAVLGVLRTDPEFVSREIPVFAPEGDRRRLPRFSPSSAELPAVRLDPGYTRAGRWGTEQHHLATLTLPFDLFTLGTHYEDREALIELFTRAIFPVDADRKESVEAAFESALVESRTLSDGGSGFRTLSSGDFAQRHRVVLTLSYLINT